MGNKKMTEEELAEARDCLEEFIKNPSSFKDCASETNIDDCKTKVFNFFKEHISGEWSTKAQKKNPYFMAKIEAATPDKIIFGVPPTFEKGYFEGNVTAKGEKYSGDATYTRTINLDLTSDEFIFFERDADFNTCKDACTYISYLKGGYYKNRHGNKTIRWCDKDNKIAAFEDYSHNVCKEELGKLNYHFDNVRVNDVTYVKTKDTTTCDFYPVYLDINETGKKKNSFFVGYYDSDKDLMHYQLKIPMSKKAKLILGGAIAAIVIIGIIVLF